MTGEVIIISWRNFHQRLTLCLPAKLSESCQGVELRTVVMAEESGSSPGMSWDLRR
jgi:hypothetical protein